TFNTNFVDFYSEYNKNMELEGYKKLYFDGLHPTKEGHRIMADIFINSINNSSIYLLIELIKMSAIIL
ncbi:hypothetical protein FE531_18965, partial [Clostridioides difficile]|uniref:SGNH/GDSL hydrolase family protein n=1 Tax=Clostridioides difficile TaxID=1496 RepID=UPI001DCDC85C